MNSTVNFILESGISLSLLAMIYVALLRKETFFRLNRFFLLGSLLFSVVLPFLKFKVYGPHSVMLPEITVTPYQNLLEVVTVHGQNFSVTVEQTILSSRLIIWIYLAGLAFFLARFLVQIGQVIFLILKNEVRKNEQIKFVFLEKECSPFSFLNYLFMSRSLENSEGYHRMTAHEMEHIRQGHSLDVLILELLTAFQWFNPFMWILRHAVRENHEFLADRAVLESGVSPGYYKKLLLNQFAGGQLVLTNNFNYSLIKNRIKMMSKIKSSKISNIKSSLGVLTAIALVVVFACEQKEMVEIQKEGKEIQVDTDMPKIPGSDEQIFFMVENMPEYPGGEMALRKFISENISYPKIAREKGVEGRVYVSFVVDKQGDVANAKIVRGVDPSLDQEALRVVNSLPAWIPGKQRGEAVNVQYTVPIHFALQ
jgi:TonB family protein